MKIRFVGAACLLAAPLLAVSAVAATPHGQDSGQDSGKKTEQTETRSAESEENAEPKKICRRIATDISSRQRTKLCMTSDEWKAWRRAQRNN